MSIRGIILMATALIAVIANFSSRKISEKFNVSELMIKSAALIVVLICVVILMIFGK